MQAAPLGLGVKSPSSEWGRKGPWWASTFSQWSGGKLPPTFASLKVIFSKHRQNPCSKGWKIIVEDQVDLMLSSQT